MLPAADRPVGDPLYARPSSAAATAARLTLEPACVQQSPLCSSPASLGIALDDSTTLQQPADQVTSGLFFSRPRPTPMQGPRRLLGQPDGAAAATLCQHFAISATLTELFAAAAAGTAGVNERGWTWPGRAASASST
jgi:hypothetical protein